MSTLLGLALTAGWIGVVSWQDWHARRIANWLLLSAVGVSVIWHLVSGAGPLGVPFAEALTGSALALLIALPFYFMGVMGGGDVKFLAVLGYLGGGVSLLATVALGALLQLTVALALWIALRRSLSLSQPLALTHGPVFIGVVLWRYLV